MNVQEELIINAKIYNSIFLSSTNVNSVAQFWFYFKGLQKHRSFTFSLLLFFFNYHGFRQGVEYPNTTPKKI